MPKQKDLTPTETVVLEALVAGKTLDEIAVEREVTQAAIYNHIRKIRAKGHTIPERDNGGAPSEPDARLDVLTIPGGLGGGKDDDLDLLVSLSAPLAENASTLLNGLSARRREIVDELKENQQLIYDTQDKITALEDRERLFEERMQAAANVAEALKPLVVS